MKDNKIEKVKNLLNNLEYVEKVKEKYQIDSKKEKSITLKILGEPNNYSRERKGKYKNFYNPKADKAQKIRNFCKESIGTLELDQLNKIFKGEKYSVSLEISYYLPIPKNDSLELTVLKELGMMKPTIRPDIDNFDKFILDALHEVLYLDDSKVVEIHSQKLYSLEPRTEVKAKISYSE